MMTIMTTTRCAIQMVLGLVFLATGCAKLLAADLMVPFHVEQGPVRVARRTIIAT
jgi:hypothetical protein